MSIQEIPIDQLRCTEDQEGLVLQGCGGELQEWVDGINEMLLRDEILQKGTKFEDVYSFRHGDVICLLFPFQENVALDMGKLAIWRLQTRQLYGSTWLSDFVPNELGGYLTKDPVQSRQKPDCSLIGRDSNIFNLMGIAANTLRENGLGEQAQEMYRRITQCESYDSALNIISDYVTITPIYPEEDMDMEQGMGMY